MLSSLSRYLCFRPDQRTRDELVTKIIFEKYLWNSTPTQSTVGSKYLTPEYQIHLNDCVYVSSIQKVLALKYRLFLVRWLEGPKKCSKFSQVTSECSEQHPLASQNKQQMPFLYQTVSETISKLILLRIGHYITIWIPDLSSIQIPTVHSITDIQSFYATKKLLTSKKL